MCAKPLRGSCSQPHLPRLEPGVLAGPRYGNDSQLAGRECSTPRRACSTGAVLDLGKTSC
jgi:hypothetical protein